MALNDVQQPIQGAYKAKKTDTALPEYDAMRARLNQQSNADVQQQQDAMQRRFASQGGLNTGAAIKQAQIVADAGVQKRDQGLQDINTQESAEQRRLAEGEANKEFQSNEAATGRSFTANESKLGREQQQGQFESNQSFQDKWNTIGQSNTIKQLDLAAKSFDLQAQESAFNQASAAAQMSDEQRQWLKQAHGGSFDINAAMEAIAKSKGDAARAKNQPKQQQYWTG